MTSSEPEQVEKVWDRTVDNGHYHCWVERTGAYTGLLKVARDGKEIFDQEVSLSFQALFGPDVDDVRLWQVLVIEAIDADYKERGEEPPT